jgi:hypothetical protein
MIINMYIFFLNIYLVSTSHWVHFSTKFNGVFFFGSIMDLTYRKCWKSRKSFFQKGCQKKHVFVVVSVYYYLELTGVVWFYLQHWIILFFLPATGSDLFFKFEKGDEEIGLVLAKQSMQHWELSQQVFCDWVALQGNRKLLD